MTRGPVRVWFLVLVLISIFAMSKVIRSSNSALS